MPVKRAARDYTDLAKPFIACIVGRTSISRDYGRILLLLKRARFRGLHPHSTIVLCLLIANGLLPWCTGKPQLWTGIRDDIINSPKKVHSPKSRFELLILGENAARGRLHIPVQLDGIVKKSGQITQTEVSINVSPSAYYRLTYCFSMQFFQYLSSAVCIGYSTLFLTSNS
jgi:hypothetical protein